MTQHPDNSRENNAPGWVKNEVSVGNLMLLLGMLGTLAAGLVEGGAIKATMQAGITAAQTAVTAEAIMRGTQADATTAQIGVLKDQMNDVRNDIRELRNIVLTDQRRNEQK